MENHLSIHGAHRPSIHKPQTSFWSNIIQPSIQLWFRIDSAYINHRLRICQLYMLDIQSLLLIVIHLNLIHYQYRPLIEHLSAIGQALLDNMSSAHKPLVKQVWPIDEAAVSQRSSVDLEQTKHTSTIESPSIKHAWTIDEDESLRWREHWLRWTICLALIKSRLSIDKPSMNQIWTIDWASLSTRQCFAMDQAWILA